MTCPHDTPPQFVCDLCAARAAEDEAVAAERERVLEYVEAFRQMTLRGRYAGEFAVLFRRIREER